MASVTVAYVEVLHSNGVRSRWQADPDGTMDVQLSATSGVEQTGVTGIDHHVTQVHEKVTTVTTLTITRTYPRTRTEVRS